MERELKASEIHILVLPYPVQGHLNPMLQFSKRLALKGLRVMLLAAMSISESIPDQAGSVKIQRICDGFDGDGKVDSLVYHERFSVVVPQSLREVVARQNCSNCPFNFLVYDSTLPWALDVAHRLGLDAAPFFTQSAVVSALYYHVHRGTLKMPVEGPTVTVPSMPLLAVSDLPSFIHHMDAYPSILRLVVDQFSNIHDANWTFINTFEQLENEVLSWMRSQWPVKTVGPIIPSMYLDKRLEDDRDYGLSLFKPNLDACQTWLDQKQAASVVYVSFGSLASLGEEQMEEISQGLKRSNAHFIWVVRESEQQKLPTNLVEETTDKGLVVNWCNQLQVLAHQAVGCFLTHCGWNSTLEALSLGVPMAAMPQWTDQTTNSKFIADVWKVGLRVKRDESGIVRGEEIALCIREIMEGERGNEIRKNAHRWKELAKEAVDEGGSSNKNIEEFVAELAEVEGDAS
ncbi:mogroside IE synthase-like [Malania oleifera]|uniref:mogroside IE synthase-like n=1 Tax=Malania oleifera TaxID=397392 RepID=UPI0025AE8DE5|nr:mogroside IE synthase-like [Malania oleifera]